MQFVQGSHGVAEGDSVNVTVQLNRNPERTVTIPIVAAGRNGAVAADFDVPDGVTFASGETRKEYTFTATDDPVDDEGEWVLLTFGTPLPTAVSLGTRDETRVNITDGDDPLKIESIAVTSTPTGGYYVDGYVISFTVTFSGPVLVDTTGGTPQFEFDIAGQYRGRQNYDGRLSQRPR